MQYIDSFILADNLTTLNHQKILDRIYTEKHENNTRWEKVGTCICVVLRIMKFQKGCKIDASKTNYVKKKHSGSIPRNACVDCET